VRNVKHVSLYFPGPFDSVTPAASGAETIFAVVIYFSCVSTLRA